MSSVSLPVDRLQRLRWHWENLGRLRGVIQVAALLLLMWGGWRATAVPVVVTVDGVSERIPSHRPTVGLLLADLGLTLDDADRLSVPLTTRLTPNLSIVVERARPVRILADGRDVHLRSWATTPRALFADAEIGVDGYDQILVNGVPLALDDPLPERQRSVDPPTYDPGYAWERLRSDPLQVRIYRAIPITVQDGNVPFEIRTTAQTVGEALRQAEITLYLGDKVQPSLGSPVSTGLHVFIQRSTPVSLQVDGRLLKTRTQGQSIGDALTEMGVAVTGLDEVSPPLETELYDNVQIEIVRVREEIEIEEDVIPFETIYRGDPNLLIDTQEVTHPGAAGITRHRYRVRYENGQEVERTLEDTWVAQEPAQRVVSYGQKIEPRTATVDGRQITYWRRIRMRATSYSASTAGVSPDNPHYGYTRTGDRMRSGIVAVDPSIIPLRSRVYVPGYGEGDALDTGSAIRARRIDLGYDDDNLQLWNRWVDVYLLWPPPPASEITWVLPNWPVER